MKGRDKKVKRKTNQKKMSDDEEDVEIFIPLLGMLEMVAFKRGLRGIGASVWVQVVFANLGDVGVQTLREFTASVLTINDKLGNSGHRHLEAKTLNLMIAEVCDMMFGPQHEVDLGEVGEDLHHE